MTRFAERLAALLPAPLDRVFLVSTGSEANDLALRLARAATGRRDVICIRDAYHGWTTATYEVSTSSVDNPLGALSPPEGVHPVLSPDTYRGPYRRGDDDAGARYADAVREAIEQLAARGPRAGGVHLRGALRQCRRHRPARRLPAGGLRARARRRRRLHRRRGAGRLRAPGRALLGLRAAGRRARHRHDREGDRQRPPCRGRDHDDRRSPSALERQGGFFASVGGGAVSCEIGLAVLDVLEEERLQENARRVGGVLRAGLEELAGRHELVGAAHGMGLYLGLDLVRDRRTKEPAREEAYAICERLRERGAIVQPTGDGENVLKLKPPLVFEGRDADWLLETLDAVLARGW